MVQWPKVRGFRGPQCSELKLFAEQCYFYICGFAMLPLLLNGTTTGLVDHPGELTTEANSVVKDADPAQITAKPKRASCSSQPRSKLMNVYSDSGSWHCHPFAIGLRVLRPAAGARI